MLRRQVIDLQRGTGVTALHDGRAVHVRGATQGRQRPRHRRGRRRRARGRVRRADARGQRRGRASRLTPTPTTLILSATDPFTASFPTLLPTAFLAHRLLIPRHSQPSTASVTPPTSHRPLPPKFYEYSRPKYPLS
jgi:hypothetical protein